MGVSDVQGTKHVTVAHLHAGGAELTVVTRHAAGTPAAGDAAMERLDGNRDPLAIPLLVVVWTALLCALIMVMVVVLMR